MQCSSLVQSKPIVESVLLRINASFAQNALLVKYKISAECTFKTRCTFSLGCFLSFFYASATKHLGIGLWSVGWLVGNKFQKSFKNDLCACQLSTDDLKNEDDIKNEDDLKNEGNPENWPSPPKKMSAPLPSP